MRTELQISPLALPHGSLETRQPGFVDSSIAQEYLVGFSLDGKERVYEQSADNFADSISIPFLAPYLRELDAYPNKVDRYDEAEKEIIMRFFENDPEGPLVSLLHTFKRNKWLNQAQATTIGERMRIGGYDFKLREWFVSDIVTGGYGAITSVDKTVEQVREKLHPHYTPNKIKAVEMHTHPLDHLFTPKDYRGMLIIVDSQRLARGIFVTCPGIQYLAIATKDTPSFTTQEEADLYVSMLEDVYADGMQQRTDQLYAEGLVIAKELDSYMQKIEPFVMPYLPQLLEMQKVHGMRDEEVEDALNGIFRLVNPLSLDEIAEIRARLHNARNNHVIAEEVYELEFREQLAKSLSVKLYRSRDMTNFSSYFLSNQ